MNTTRTGSSLSAAVESDAESAGPARFGFARRMGGTQSRISNAILNVTQRDFLPASVGIGLMFVVGALQDATMPADSNWWISALLDLGAALGSFVLGFFVFHHLTPLRMVNLAGVELVGLVLLNRLAEYRLADSSPEPLHYMLLLLGIGAFFVSLPWFLLAVAMVWAIWLSYGLDFAVLTASDAANAFADRLLTAPGVALGVATLLSGLVFIVRSRRVRTEQLVRLNRERLSETDNPPSAPVDFESPFRGLTDASIEAIVVHENGRILEVSQQLGTLLGYEPAALVGKSVLDLIAPEARTRATTSLFIGNLKPTETIAVGHDCSTTPVEVLSKVARHRGHNVTITNFRSLTERKQMVETIAAEQRRQEQNYRREATLARLDVALDAPQPPNHFLNEITRLAAEILPASGGACILLRDEKSGEIRGATDTDRLPSSPLLLRRLVRNAGATKWVFENRQPLTVSTIAHDPFAAEHHFEADGVKAYAAFPLLDEGHCLGVFYVFDKSSRNWHSGELNFLTALASRAALAIAKVRVVERLRQTNEQLASQHSELQLKNEELQAAKVFAENASRTKSDFLDTMSHELRTPMHGVLGMTHLLMSTELSPEQREYAQTVQSSAESLLKMIDEILGYSRLESGRLKLEPQPFAARENIASATAVLKPRAQAKVLELELEISAEIPPTLVGDAVRLRQVIHILLSNAVKFTERGKINVRATGHSEGSDTFCLRVEVSDTGIGMTAQTIPKLFVPFTQADGSASRKFGGIGLGLAIAKQVVELMGGQIGVQSTPGEGSTFWFTAKLKRP